MRGGKNMGNMVCAVIEIMEMIFYGDIFLERRGIKKRACESFSVN